MAAAGIALALAGCDTVSNLGSQPAVAELDTRDTADASVPADLDGITVRSRPLLMTDVDAAAVIAADAIDLAADLSR